MRKSIIYLILGLLAVSCSEDNKTDSSSSDKVHEDISSSDFGEDQAFEDEQLENEMSETEAVYIEELPSLWLNINQNEDGETYNIYHYCEAEDAAIQFMAEKGDDWSLYTGWGQDGDVRKIEGFEASQSLEDNVEIVKGSFLLHRPSGEESKYIEFVWNKSTMIAEFSGLEYNSPYFIPEENMSLVEEISEDCEGLWD